MLSCYHHNAPSCRTWNTKYCSFSSHLVLPVRLPEHILLWYQVCKTGIFTSIPRAVVATTTLSGPSMGAKLCKTFVFKASGVLLWNMATLEVASPSRILSSMLLFCVFYFFFVLSSSVSQENVTSISSSWESFLHWHCYIVFIRWLTNEKHIFHVESLDNLLCCCCS